MRVRLPFAAGFLLLLLLSSYAGLTRVQLGQYVNDKVLHFVTFFLLTVVFYWVIDTNRRRILNLTLIVCTVVLGVGSEFVQSFLPNDRNFDVLDIAANVVGSLAGAGLCTIYHKRMLERRRQRKHYNAVPGEDDGDLELGEGHETGVTDSRPRTLEEEVDNWDENQVDDWDEEDAPGVSHAPATTPKDKNVETGDLGESKKRVD
ncbi:VanZ like family protein [Mariannaea sp. PMI_226]|nr:VanZ like family protein [Mariannaea sp. PMI_226]